MSADDPAGAADVYPASIADPGACDRFVLREARGLDTAARTPLWMRVRLARCGLRCVSLAVDITNYVMLELGQPLHAFDRSKLSGPIVVRRARPGERLETLDHVLRTLDPDDILITDSSGPISMAGTMGGIATEIDENSADLVIEAAHFSAEGTARMGRRHKLSTEASYRFERGVDRELPLRASAQVVSMLATFGGAGVVPGRTHASVPVPPVTITMPASYPDEVAGAVYGRDTVIRRLREVGCGVPPGPAAADGRAPADPKHLRHDHGRHDRSATALVVSPPSWRPDLTDPSDLAEEVIRLEGYANIPVAMPRAPAGRGLTARQRTRRSVGRALAAAGYVEVLSWPFGPAGDADALQLPPEDPRRLAVKVTNPLSEDEPLLRTTLLPGLLRTLARNIGRGFADVALFEMGLVFHPRPGGTGIVAHPRRGPCAHGGRAQRAERRAARSAAAGGRGAGRPARAARLVGERRAARLVGRRGAGGPRGGPGLPGAGHRPCRAAAAVASRALRGRVRAVRRRSRVAGRVRRGAASPGAARVRPAGPGLRHGDRPFGDRDRG